MTRIKVRTPLVELDGDEMTRVVWHAIRTRLILPYLELDLRYHDLGLPHRNATDDQVTLDAAHALRRYGVGVKCATITPTPRRMAEYGLHRLLPSPNVTIRTILNGVLFREPIICGNVPRLLPHWTRPIVIGRHAHGDIHGATELHLPTPGTLSLSFTPADGSTPQTLQVVDLQGPGIALAMHNTQSSIDGFARACFNHALSRHLPVYLSTKDTILPTYDGFFRDRFQSIFDTEFAPRFATAGLFYEHRLIDDMVASALKWPGGYLWACQNYDGDIMSDLVAQGFGSLGLMTSVLTTPDGATVQAEAAHGTVTRHFRAHQAGQETSTNPLASIFAWTRALSHRARLDNTPDVLTFAETLERVCIQTVESGHMTKDLATLIAPDHPFLSTQAFLGRIEENLKQATA